MGRWISLQGRSAAPLRGRGEKFIVWFKEQFKDLASATRPAPWVQVLAFAAGLARKMRITMPPVLLLDLGKIDINRVIYGVEEIERVNPHRYEMRQLDGIVHLDVEAGEAMGFKEVTEDEFWARGHIPWRPLMPGVLMIEAAAQLASFAAKQTIPGERFIGFGGIEDVKFRGQVIPPCRLYLLGKFFERRPRRFKFAAQGLVEGQLVFHAKIIGMPI